MIDVFRVGVHIGMSTNSSQILAHMIRELTGVHVAAGKVEQSLKAMKTAAIGAGMAFAGFAALKVMGTLLEKGIAFNEQLAKMKGANYAPVDIKTLEAQAYVTMKAVPGSNLVDILKNLQDIRNLSGGVGHAAVLSEVAERTNQVLHNQTGKPAEEAGYKFLKFLEDAGRMIDTATGKFDEHRVTEWAKSMQAIIATFKGRVTGDDLFQFRQSGKASVSALSDQGIVNLTPAIQSLTAVSVGTAVQGANQQFLGAVQLNKHTVEMMEDYKLFDPSKVHRDKKTGRYTLDRGALTDSQTFITDKFTWIKDVLLPHLMAPHMEKGKMVPGLDRQGALEEVGRFGWRTPWQGLVTDIMQNLQAQMKDIEFINNAKKVDQYKVMDEVSPEFRITKFTEAWTNLGIALGKTIDITLALVPFTNALNALNAAAVAHPDAARALLVFAGSVAALTALAGIAVMASGLLSLAGGVGALTAVSGLSTLGAALAGVGTGLAALAAPIAAVMGILKLGSDAETPENRAALERLNKLRRSPDGGPNGPTHDGFGPDGRPQTIRPGKQSSNTPGLHYVVVTNADDMARYMTGGLARGVSRPSAGPSFQDYRMGIPQPGVGALA